MCLFGGLLHREELHISNSYVNLVIINNPEEKEENQPKDITQAYQNEREQNNNSLYAAKTPVELEKLFDNPQHTRQLITGTAGIGKTTLCQHLFYQWIENGLWSNKFVAVFWIPLRNLKDSNTKIPDNNTLLLAHVVRKHALSGASRMMISEKKLRDFIAQNANKILWLFDGYDEVISEANTQGHVIQVFIEEVANFDSAILMTSRPQPQYS